MIRKIYVDSELFCDYFLGRKDTREQYARYVEIFEKKPSAGRGVTVIHKSTSALSLMLLVKTLCRRMSQKDADKYIKACNQIQYMDVRPVDGYNVLNSLSSEKVSYVAAMEWIAAKSNCVDVLLTNHLEKYANCKEIQCMVCSSPAVLTPQQLLEEYPEGNK